MRHPSGWVFYPRARASSKCDAHLCEVPFSINIGTYLPLDDTNLVA
jgi:hypothetical protein